MAIMPRSRVGMLIVFCGITLTATQLLWNISTTVSTHTVITDNPIFLDSAGVVEIGNLRNKNMSFFAVNEDIIENGIRGNSSGSTSPVTSSYEILGNIHTDNGDFVHILITARDENGQRKLGGGDLWTATLTSKSGNYSTSGRIEDYSNGTYSVYFIAAWSAKSMINITLVHSSESAQYLKYNIWPTCRLYFTGFYISGNTEDTSICTIASTSENWYNKCEYTHPTALGNHLFLCDMPGKNLSCKNLIDYGQEQTNNKTQIQENQDNQVKKLLHGNEFLFTGVHKKYSLITLGPRYIDLHKGNVPSKLPLCKDILQSNARSSSGYWEASRWRSLACKNSHFGDKHDVGNCLRNKRIYIMGILQCIYYTWPCVKY
ncbi:NXPE family member 2-like [Amphiura filiformis]|uniref:NXPE family member 2-like n=1 Tax=Amphiura filiformis TaxID=82378 RepID=UPI003B20D7D0